MVLTPVNLDLPTGWPSGIARLDINITGQDEDRLCAPASGGPTAIASILYSQFPFVSCPLYFPNKLFVPQFLLMSKLGGDAVRFFFWEKAHLDLYIGILANLRFKCARSNLSQGQSLADEFDRSAAVASLRPPRPSFARQHSTRTVASTRRHWQHCCAITLRLSLRRFQDFTSTWIEFSLQISTPFIVCVNSAYFLVVSFL